MLYGKINTPSEIRQKSQTVHREQLQSLLLNKLRNKYQSAIQDDQTGKLETFILIQINNLLNSGTANEAGLQALDLKIENQVSQLKKQFEEQAKLTSQNLEKLTKSQEGHSKQSIRSSKSLASRSHMSLAGAKAIKNVTVIHSDPAAALNPTEEQWNEIVQENLKKFDNEIIQKQAYKAAKLKAVQDEQLKQMQVKNELKKKEIEDTQKFFKEVTIDATNKLYKNEDKKKRQNDELKGNSNQVARELNEGHRAQQNSIKQRMQLEAEQRLRQLEEMRKEDELTRKQENAKKQHLREVQMADMTNKQDIKNNLQEKINKSLDFASHNVLSYVYQNKQSKAFQYQAKNDKILELFKDQFQGETYQRNIEKETEERGRAIDISEKEKKDKVKAKEREIKEFQEKQIAERQAKKQIEQAQREADLQLEQKNAEDYKKREKEKLDKKRQINQVHVQQVLQQIKEEPRTFAKTGIAIIRN